MKIRALVKSYQTGAILFHPEIFYLEKDGDLVQEPVVCNENGFFEFFVPDYVSEIFVRNKFFDSLSVVIPKNKKEHSIIIKMKKNKRNYQK